MVVLVLVLLVSRGDNLTVDQNFEFIQLDRTRTRIYENLMILDRSALEFMFGVSCVEYKFGIYEFQFMPQTASQFAKWRVFGAVL